MREAGIPVMGGALSGRATAEMAIDGLDARTLAAWQSYFATSSGAFPGLNEDAFAASSLRLERDCVPTGFTVSRKRSDQGRRPFVFIMDEAGMVGASQMRAVLEAVDRRGGKLVLVGDEGQLQPVGEIGLYADMRLQLDGVTIDSVRRQSNPLEREASVQLARRNPELVLNFYAAQGSVHEVEKLDHAVEQMGAAYWSLGDGAGVNPALEGRVLGLTHRNADVRKLNGAIRGGSKGWSSR